MICASGFPGIATMRLRFRSRPSASLMAMRDSQVESEASPRKALDDEICPVLLDAFPFAGRRCERLTQAVMRRLGFEP